MREALGNALDVSIGAVPSDAVAAAITGKRVALKNADHLAIVVCATGASTDTLACTLSQHTAKTGGTTSNLAIIDHWHQKSAATLAGTEGWSKQTQAAAATFTLGVASQQLIAVVEVNGDSLSDGYGYVSLSIAQGSNASHYTTVLYVLSDLKVRRKPANLAAGLV